MPKIKITYDRGLVDFRFFYLGWNRKGSAPIHENDVGEETFGIAFGNYYIGHYTDGKWCKGFLNKNGCLD